jgi:methyl-accepting chemotaxis protein
MTNIYNTDSFRNSVIKAKITGLFLCLFLLLQVTFFSPEAIAAPFSNMGKQVDKITQDLKTDMAIDKAAGNVKELSRNVRNGRTDKVIDMAANTAKDMGNRAKEFSNDVKDGTKENIDKVQKATKNASNKIGDRTGQVLDKTKDLSEQAGNKLDEVVDSVKGFLGQ